MAAESLLHPHERCRKLDASSQAEAVSHAEALGCSIPVNHPGDSERERPKSGWLSGMLASMPAERYRPIVVGELGPRRAAAFDDMTISAHDRIMEITGTIVDPSHLHGLLEWIAGLGLTRWLWDDSSQSGEDAGMSRRNLVRGGGGRDGESPEQSREDY